MKSQRNQAHLPKASVLLGDKQLFYTKANGNILGTQCDSLFLKTQPKTERDFSISPRIPGIHISSSSPSKVLQWQSLWNTELLPDTLGKFT